LKFELYSQSDVHGAVFYLNRGSENITIQNCILENKTPALRDKVYLPHVKHSDADGFYFERDSASVGDSYDGYSAGIASRGTLFDAIVVRFDSNGDPIDPTEEQTPDQEIEKRTMVLDTIPNSHNTFKNNEISGFGYGILSTGLGALFNTREAKYTRYYNKGNVIEGNIITDVARAGIFVGNEEDLTIKNNIISGVSGEGDGKAAAIQVGTSSRGAYKAFNNLEVDIQGNTINGVTGSDYSNGIRIEQGFTRFVDPIGGFEVFPGDDDNITATSNAIWNIKVMNAATGRAGIYALTERIEDKNEYTVLTNPLYPDYLIKNLAITNNTILLGNDGFDNEGLYFGVGIQQATNVTYANNAISIKDNVSAGATIRAASFLQGLSPNKGFINSDCNAIWMTDADMDVVRFIESTPMTINDHLATGFLHSGYNGEYKTIRQWRNWTGMDKNTTTHKDFTDNYTFTGTPAKLAIVTPKPIASILNNRGLNLEGDHYDMNGLRRGASNEPFDIGAIEFNSKMRGLDGELIDIIAPANYRESVGTFNGCEYVMTTAPVEVAAYVRNNGTILQTKLPVTVKIDRDDYGTLHNVLETTVYANVASYASVEVPFGLADGAGVEFKPETYAELDMPIDDNTFYGMEENVTPVYTITVTSGDDEDNTNNVSVKKVRFYVMRSGMKLLECNENLMANYETSSNPEVLASNLNAAAIEAGLREIGYYNVTRQEAMANKELNLDVDTEYKQDIDRFNRNSWPERSLDYSMYRTVIWSDGNNNNLSRYSAMALRDFVNSIDENSTDLKKNLLVASEEIVRNNVGLDIDYNFTQEVFFATSKDPHTPMGIDKDMGTYNAYNNKTVTGVDIARQMEETIRATSNANDMLPYPGLLSLVEGDGLTKTAFIYNETADGIGEEVPEDNRIMGVTHVETDKNILLYAVDWRHFGDIENMLRASLDFVTKSGGEVVPIDMYSFDANAVGNRVELNWSTASEANSSHFDIERRNDDATFATIASKEAAGNSNNIRHYNMTDNEVKLGNTYTYRLKLVDKDGSFSYSGNQTVTLESATGSLTVGELAPNPTANSSAINVTLSESADLRIELFNAAGALVAVAYDAYTPAGSRSINIDVAKLAQGSYTVVIRSGQNSEVKTMNVIR
jgi:hypothetical protein